MIFSSIRIVLHSSRFIRNSFTFYCSRFCRGKAILSLTSQFFRVNFQTSCFFHIIPKLVLQEYKIKWLGSKIPPFAIKFQLPINH